jgi:hypothetical protein
LPSLLMKERGLVSANVRTSNKVRMHTLLTIQARTPVLKRAGLGPASKGKHCDYPVILLVIDNNKAPNYNPSHFNSLSVDHSTIVVHPPNPKIHLSTLPPDVPPAPPALTTLSLHPLRSPSQTWYKATHHYTPAPPESLDHHQLNSGKHKMNNSDRVHPILAILGTTPYNLANDMANHSGRNPDDFHHQVNQVSKIILNRTIDLLRKDEAYYKWRRKRAEWDE